jgi:glycosyltransferase involved in cell wall biosynthesis
LGLNYAGTVYNGIDPTTYEFHPTPDSPPYLAFLGRLSPEKGPHLAIEIAKRSGWHLKIAGKIDAVDQEFYETELRPHIDGTQIEYLGEANHVQKSIVMGGAVATLFPITWREPFGLVMIESMVTGTPVIALDMGATSEVIADGESGFLCHSVEECVAAIDKAKQLDRLLVRQYVLEHFTAKQMADGYEAIYNQLLSERIARNGYVHGSALSA